MEHHQGACIAHGTKTNILTMTNNWTCTYWTNYMGRLKLIHHAKRQYYKSLSAYFLLLLLSITAPTSKAYFCDPNDAKTCRFMGKCEDIRVLPQFFWGSASGNELDTYNQHVCRCPLVFCYERMGFDPVCGEDGETYYNELCRVIQECTIQRTIKRRCRGVCHRDSCIKVEEDEEAKDCGEEDEHFCLNNGICKIYPKASKAPFCTCGKGFIGRRCERRSFVSQINGNGKKG